MISVGNVRNYQESYYAFMSINVFHLISLIYNQEQNKHIDIMIVIGITFCNMYNFRILQVCRRTTLTGRQFLS